MPETLDVRLARIEEMLKAHFQRDDERAKRWENHETRIHELESSEQRRKGGVAALTVLCTMAGTAGALIVKLWPFGR